MSLPIKLAVDHYIGGVIAWGLNVCARLLAFAWRRNHNFDQPPETVLLLKFMGLGSIARAAFLLPEIRRNWPNTKIVFATFPSCAALVRQYPEVDEVIIVRDELPFAIATDSLKLILKSWKLKTDLVIDLEVHSKYSSIISVMTCARNRAGFANLASRFRRGLYTHLVFWNPFSKVDEAYQQLGRAIGFSLETDDTRYPPTLPHAAVREAGDFLDSLGYRSGDLLLGINANASEFAPERRWPIESFAKVIGTLADIENLHIVLLGSPAEAGYNQSLLALCPENHSRIHNIAGLVSFTGFLSVLQQLSLLISNDSGPLHLARSFGTPCISLWGPTHPLSYSPSGSDHIAFHNPIYCSPCVHTTDVAPCAGDNQCLKRLDWPRVAQTAMEMLSIVEHRLPENLVNFPDSQGESIPSVHGMWSRELGKKRLING